MTGSVVDMEVVREKMRVQCSNPQNGYENYLDDSRRPSSIVAGIVDQKRDSTTSTASTVRCEDVVVMGKPPQSPSLLSRFGFIRRQSGNLQKFGVSV